MSTTSVRLIASVALAAFPLGAFAQQSSAYTPPKLAKSGASSTPVPGPGIVTIQVLVKKDGTFSVSRIIKSTNPADNAIAIEIAKTSKYAPARRDGEPVDGYYDYILALGGAVVIDQSSTSAGPTAHAYDLIRDGKYADATAELQTYLQAHPGDVQASTLLGVANAFAGNDDDAAKAFDAVPTIPDQYRALAGQAYAKHAGDALAAQKYDDAIAAAGHVIALTADSPDGYYVRGVANANQGHYQAAVPDLQKALDLSKSTKTDDKSLANIEFSLAIAQLNSGAYDAAATTAKDVMRLDPLQQPKLQQAEYVAVANDAIGLANAGKIPEAIAAFDAGATVFPASAANFYSQAAYIMLTVKTPDYKKVKAEADRALAADPANGRALFVNAIVASQAGDQKTALADMNKAKTSPLYAGDASFAKQVDDNLKKLTASGN
jgi:tetratricopeptide (TPR) repeat protein